MSAKVPSRDFAQGRVKKLQRMRRPVVLELPAQLEPRNYIARALARRAASSAAGKHVRGRGAQRRADKVALAKLIRAAGMEAA
jgi:hypothetical protein